MILQLMLTGSHYCDIINSILLYQTMDSKCLSDAIEFDFRHNWINQKKFQNELLKINQVKGMIKQVYRVS